VHLPSPESSAAKLCLPLDRSAARAHTHRAGPRRYSARHPLHWAARNGHLHILQWLLAEEQDCDVDRPTSDGTTALCMAAWQGHLGIVRFLVEGAGADPTAVNSYGCNVAMW
jgi:ankyrin repeat protein